MNVPQTEILSQVLKPARYTGQEWNSSQKNLDQVELSVALAFPDVYEVGLSNLGYKILYHILNSHPQISAERAYAPWVDMEAKLRQAGLPLTALESGRSLDLFDLVGFSLQYELSYSNVLNMLDLAGIPLLSRERQEQHPLIVAGGPCAFNGEPLADFVDFFVIGEGEEVMVEVAEQIIAWKQGGRSGGRLGALAQLAAIPGVYVPAFYEVSYNQAGCIEAITTIHPAASAVITKRLVKDLDQAAYPSHPVVPYLDVVHDRIMLEVFRGCTRGCRFCQAGMIYRPVRERRPETILALARQLADSTGYSEISLTSLSSADYSCLPDLVRRLMVEFQDEGISVSLPSLRIDSFSIQLAKEVQKVRKSGLTFAPEAGTQRLRDVINKGVSEDDLQAAVSAAFQAGWTNIKLYFMIGLPTETDEDIVGIADLAHKVLNWYKDVKGRRGAKVTISVSSFVPKPHTPFQWIVQDDLAETQRKQQLLRSHLKDRNISYNWHEANVSALEGVFARGDRRLGQVLLAAWEMGAKFDGWSEHFKFSIWQQAFEQSGIDPEFYNRRQRSMEEKMPWNHLSSGVDIEYFAREYEQSLGGGATADCRRGQCQACGACQHLAAQIIDWGGRG